MIENEVQNLDDDQDAVLAGLEALKAAQVRAEASDFSLVLVRNQVVRNTKTGTVVIANLPGRVKVGVRSKRASS